MAYNWRREYLLANRHIVDRLIEIADKKDWVQIDLPNPEEAYRQQYVINNLLTSLARWEPARAYVRATVRCHIQWASDTTACHLFVGVPPASIKLRGFRPSPFVNEAKRPQTESQLEFTQPITSENWATFSISLLRAKTDGSVTEVVVQHPPTAEGIQFIAEQLSPEFEVVHAAPTLRLRRVTKPPPVQ